MITRSHIVLLPFVVFLKRLSPSRSAFLIVLVSRSALHSFSRPQPPERPPNPLCFLCHSRNEQPGGLRRRARSGVAGRYGERVVIVVNPETLAFCFIRCRSGRKRRLRAVVVVVPEKRTGEQSSPVPEGLVIAEDSARNDPSRPNASNFKGAHFKTRLV